MTAESIPGEYYPKLFKKPNNKQKPNAKSPKGPNLLKKSLGVPRSTRSVFAIMKKMSLCKGGEVPRKTWGGGGRVGLHLWEQGQGRWWKLKVTVCK